MIVLLSATVAESAIAEGIKQSKNVDITNLLNNIMKWFQLFINLFFKFFQVFFCIFYIDFKRVTKLEVKYVLCKVNHGIARDVL